MTFVMSSCDHWSAPHTCSYLGKICRSTHKLGEDTNYKQLDDMIHAGSIHIFTICFKIQQIEDILRYLGEDDNQESAPSLPHLKYQLPHLSHCLHRPVLLHSTRGWQPPLKDSLDLLSYTTTITPTRRGLLGTAVTPGEFVCALTTDFYDVQPQHCRGGKITFHHSRKS